jgi:RNA polymerase sigma factor (sigma-70 family)
MFTICLRMLNNREDAEDVLQESFISAFKNLHQYNAKASFGSWLKRIVINASIAVIKKKNDHLIPLGEKDLPEEPAQEDEEITYDIETVKLAISKLADGYRLIVSLYLFEDHSHKMIAEKLNISESTSKSQYSRARKRLIELIRSKNGIS